MAYDFEAKLADLIAEAREAGATTDEIISAFELQKMALTEEQE